MRLNGINQTLLKSGVAKLGPLAAANALTAFKTGRRGSWNSCVLARAHGADGELKRDARKRKEKVWQTAPVVLGLSVFESEAIMAAFDHPADRKYLRYLLEQEAAKMTATTAPEPEVEPVMALSVLAPASNDSTKEK